MGSTKPSGMPSGTFRPAMGFPLLSKFFAPKQTAVAPFEVATGWLRLLVTGNCVLPLSQPAGKLVMLPLASVVAVHSVGTGFVKRSVFALTLAIKKTC